MCKLPFVSILIPALNEDEFIGLCISALKNQDYPNTHYEILVMDNGSLDRTREIAENLDVKVLDASNRLIGAVRNLGAENSLGSVLAYIDADCIAPTHWLKSGVDLLFSDPNVGAVGGTFDLRDGANWIERAWILNESKPLTRLANILATGSFFIRKEDFQKVDGFHEGLSAGEDTQLSRKLTHKNKGLIKSSDISVIHLGYPRTLKEFFKRQVWQSSDYLNTKKSIFDPTFILTHIFIVSFFMIMASVILINNVKATLFFLFFHLLIPVVLAIYRYTKSRRKIQLVLLLQVIFINYFYLIARSKGLVKSYLNYGKRI